ncbi:MAG TPA: cytochrome P450 [Terriglobales bacterium]|jgi:hypothetical protein
MDDSSQPANPHADDFSVPSPRVPYYDDSNHSWVLTRYVDVQAALSHPALQLGSSVEDVPETSTTTAAMRIRTQDALSPPQLDEWRSRFEHSVQAIISGLARNAPIDLMKEVIRPWTLQAAFEVTHADLSQTKRLSELAALVSSAAAEPRDPDLKERAKLANKELQQLFPDPQSPISGPAFVALSQTLAALLSNGWLALLQHPSELASLHRDLNLTQAAVEEMLRFCALPRTLSRVAIADTNISGVIVPCGERVVLYVASANRDPHRFADANRFALSRRSVGHFSLGAGSHACVGASLIRMAMDVATRAFAVAFASAQLHGPVEWRGGSGFRWPEVIPVNLNRA